MSWINYIFQRSANSVRAAIAFSLFAFGAISASAQVTPPGQAPALEPEEALLRTIPYFSQDNQPIGKVLQALGRSYGISVICDKDVTGDVNVEFYNITLRGILDALCSSEGYYWQLESSGYVSVRRFKTILYQIEYPQLDRKGTSKASVNLGQTNYNPSSNGSGGGGGGGSGGGGGGSGSSGQEDTAKISVDQTNDTKFWQQIEKEVQNLAQKEERIIFDRFSGTILATASRRTHEHIEAFLNNVNGRIAQQVEILAKLVEVQLSDQNKLGIDWALAATSIGDLKVQAGAQTSNIATPAGGDTDAANTFVGIVGLGKVAAVVSALQQQGSLNTVTAPRLVTINNQTAYLKDTNDKPYFQLNSTTNQSGFNNNGSVLQNKNYTVTSISIGTIVAITPHVADNGDVTLDVIPALTRWIQDVKSPDGYSTAPELAVKMASTIVRLRSGETAIIGGIITDTESTSTKKVPGLGSIPLVGRLFRTDGKYKSKTELVIFLTPRILVPGKSLSPRDLQQAEQDSRAIRNSVKTEVSSRPNMAPGRAVESISLFGDDLN